MSSISSPLKRKRVLVVGGTSGIALEVVRQIASAGGEPILAGRDLARTRAAVREAGLEASTQIATVNLDSEASIQSLAAEMGRIDFLVSLAANHANGPVEQLEPDAIHAAFDAKVIGPILLVKHLQLADDAAVVLFSGFVARRPSPGLSVMAAANAAVSALADALATELAPRRAVAISPGIIDSGAWNGETKEKLFAETSGSLPVGHVGHVGDVAAAVLFVLTNPFVTATTLDVDGGALVA